MTKIIANLRTAFESRRAYNRTIVEIERLIAREEADLSADRAMSSTDAHRRIDGTAL